MSELAGKIVDREKSLAAERIYWETFWQSIANYVQPRKAHIQESWKYPSTEQVDRLFDTTAGAANLTLANGRMGVTTSIDDVWFKFQAPAHIDDDAAHNWYSTCSEITLQNLILSGFYSARHENLLDNGGFGTASLFVEDGRNTPYSFQAHEIGTYSIAENAEGVIDTYYRTVEMNVRQVVDEYGIKNVSEKTRKAYEKAQSKPEAFEEKVEVILAIEPRQDRDYWRMDAKNLPFLSVHVEKKEKHLLREKGYETMPALVSRHLLWDKRAGPYGWSPSWFAIPDARQANLLEQMSDTVAELRAFPRLLAPAGMEGDVDLLPGGITYFDPWQENGIPQEWMTQGRIEDLEFKLNHKREMIEKHFHVDLFQLMTNLEGSPPSATQILEMRAEKLALAQPFITRDLDETVTPLLKRLFIMDFKAGRYPEPPESVFRVSDEGVELEIPEVEHLNKFSLAVQSTQMLGFMRIKEAWGDFIELRPDILDNVDLDAVFRDYWRKNSQKSEHLVDEELVSAYREEKAAAMQREQEAALALEGAKAASGLVEKTPLSAMA